MKLSLKHKIIIISALVGAEALFTLIFKLAELRMTTQIAFYQISPELETVIKNEIFDNGDIPVKFHSLDSTKALTKKQASAYDIIFTLNSRTTVDIQGHAVSENVVNHLPSKIKNSVFQDDKYYALPILLDHFEIALYKTYQSYLNEEYPYEYSSFKEYLKNVKQYADFPLIAIGTDDYELIGFVSTLAQSMFGVEEYFEICNELNRAQARNEELPYRIRVVLDEIKNLENEGLLHKNWLMAKKEDITFLMEQHQLAAIATYLSTQRTLPYHLIKYYDSYFFPQSGTVPFGVIAPEICAVKMKDEKRIDSLFEKLVSAESQTRLSDKSMLSPSASVAESCDEQADNVRFWCASTKAGPLPVLRETSFITPERFHAYAEMIREYLK